MQLETQNLINLLQNKNYQQTITKCQQLLKTSNHPQIHLFLAIALGGNGDLTASEEIFINLLKHFPTNTDVLYNYGLILQNHHKYQLAAKQYEACLHLQPQNYSAWNNLGEIHRTLKNFPQAINAFENSLKLQPHNIQYSRNLGIAYYQNNAFEKALPLLLNTINKNSANAEDFIALLDILITLRQLKLATDISVLAQKKYINNADILNLIGLNELEKRKFNPAIIYFEKSLQIRSNDYSTLCHLATAQMFTGKQTNSMETLGKILKLNTTQAYVHVCTLYDTNNQDDLAKKTLKEGLKRFPNNPELLLIKARMLRKNKQYKPALALVKGLSKLKKSKVSQATLLYEKAHIQDKQQKFNKAWKSFNRANKACLANWKNLHPSKDTFLKTCKSIVTDYKKITHNTQNSTEGKSGENLVFIIGFPRSGTTLLDSILSAHTDVTVLEEAPIIGETYDSAQNLSLKNYAKEINMLSSSDWKKLRKHYFSLIPDYSDWNKKGILVDKSPLNTMHTGFIHKLFPKARIIFSQRHPLDVCLSCFFQDFKMNSFMTNMTDIKSTAKTYNAMMNVWKISVEKFNIDVRNQSYENLVTDFESETRELIKFLNLPWQNQVLNYQQELKKRGAISTPSYDQVNQPIYQSAKNRYKNYLPHLDEAIEILQPWIDYFDYEV